MQSGTVHSQGCDLCLCADPGFGGRNPSAMSNNKLTSVAAQPTSDLSTLTTPTQPTLGNLHPPTQPLVATPLGAHTLNLSANTLNTLNALNNPTQALNTLNSPTQQGIPSSQAFLSSPQVTSIVSLPQTFCFPSQPSQTSVSAASQPTALLGFPMAATAALNSNNTISLNTNTIPLNASAIPLNASSISLNTGSPISQQLVQSLSMGQQPTICASLPQTLSFPLSQALLGISNTTGSPGGQFLSTFSQFQGLPSVIMGTQQSVLQGALMGHSTAAQSAQLQTVGTINPQSLSFPVTAGPVVTELPVTSQPAQETQASSDKQQSPPTPSGQPDPPKPPSPSDPEGEPQTQLAQQEDPYIPSDQQGAMDVHQQPSQADTASPQPAQGEGEGNNSPAPAASPPPAPPPSHSQAVDQSSAAASPQPSIPVQNPQSEVEQPGSDGDGAESEQPHTGAGCAEEAKGDEGTAGSSNGDYATPLESPSQADGEQAMEETCETHSCPGDIKQEALVSSARAAYGWMI